MKQESGRSMIEMLGVLAIMGAISYTAIVGVGQLMGAQKHNRAEGDVTYIVTEVQKLFRGADDFSNINNATIFSAIGISNKNPYGGTYTLSVDPANSRQFIVGITGLNKSDCEYLKTKVWMNSVGYQTSDGKVSGATGDCSGANGTNSIQITFGD